MNINGYENYLWKNYFMCMYVYSMCCVCVWHVSVGVPMKTNEDVGPPGAEVTGG